MFISLNARLLAAVTGSALLASLAFAACSDGEAKAVIDAGDGGTYQPKIDPANFVPRVDHPFFPLKPGSRWVYDSDDGSEHIEVVVLEETRLVMGIAATVVRDTVTEDGEVVEDTFDWYAQDRDGNVWYLGEDSTEFKDGKPDNKHGSWEAGVGGALPGMIMLADPRPGAAYRQELLKGEAEDLAEVVALDGTATVPLGTYDGLLVTKEWNPLDPKVVEQKYYARGVGLVMEEKVTGARAKVLLVRFEPGK
jgi:hypothetical protein